jgi:broad specificity phosphatase PhoE
VPAWPERLSLVRHAESVGNLADRAAHDAGSHALDLDDRDADVRLSERGRHQAQALGRWLAALPEPERPTAVVCSPYRRAAETAAAAVDAAGLDLPLRVDERLRERDLGMFDGLTGLGIRDRFPEEAQRRARIGKLYYRPPGGESWVDVALRVRSFLGWLRQEHSGDRVLVATHQAVIMNFRYVLEALPEDELLAIDRGDPLPNCSVTCYQRGEDGSLQLRVAADTGPLASLDEPVTQEEDRDDEA